MKKRVYLFIILMISILLVIACSLPGQKTSSSLFTITPNQTMTALFASNQTALSGLSTVVPDVTLTVTPTDIPTGTSTLTSTPTATPTNTFLPPTLTPIPARTGSMIYVPYLNHTISFDGMWDEWTSYEYPANYVIYGYNNWVGGSDLQSSFRLSWNYDALYIAVKVLDDTYVQNSSGQNLYKGDCLEILFDADLYGDYYSRQLTWDDYQFGISPGTPDINGLKEVFLYFPHGKAGSLSNVIIGSTSGEGVYRIEAAFPWSIFGINPQPWQHFGFAVRVSDNDNAGANEQQSMVTNVSGNVLVDPTTWGEIVLNR